MSAKKIVQDEFGVDVNETTQDEKSEIAQNGGTPASANGRTGKARASQPFDPAQYLSNFDGRDYLEVKWRLLWLRSEHPDARMATEIVQHNEESGFALFRAEVEIPSGGKATGWGSETVRDFHDYIEAAETKALGRALAALGYGTQFCQDFDFSAKARPGVLQVVDAPVNVGARSANRAGNGGFVGAPKNGSPTGNAAGNATGSFTGGFNKSTRPTPQNVSGMGGRLPAQDDDFDRLPTTSGAPQGADITEKQLKAIYAIGRASKRLSEDQLDDHCAEIFGVRPAELTKAEASQFIDMLKGEMAA